MPLQPRRDGCAVIGRGSGNCQQTPPTLRAVWRFEPPEGPKRILLCDQHAVELAGHERLRGVVQFYDATVED